MAEYTEDPVVIVPYLSSRGLVLKESYSYDKIPYKSAGTSATVTIPVGSVYIGEIQAGYDTVNFTGKVAYIWMTSIIDSNGNPVATNSNHYTKINFGTSVSFSDSRGRLVYLVIRVS